MALTLALDREVLTGKLLHDLYLPAYTLVPAYGGYEPALPEWVHWTAAQRHARARQLYAEAGYSRDHPLQVDLSYPTSGPDTRRVLEALAAMWQVNLGAEVRLANEEWRVHQQNRRLSLHALFWNAWIGDYPDPQTFLDLYRVGSPQNHGKYRNDTYERLITLGSTTGDAAVRTQAWHQAESQLNADAAYIPVYYYQSRHLIRPWVKGWQGNIMDRHLSRDLWLSVRNIN
jgi:oligopeptide transport system substrate-binding protein